MHKSGAKVWPVSPAGRVPFGPGATRKSARSLAWSNRKVTPSIRTHVEPDQRRHRGIRKGLPPAAVAKTRTAMASTGSIGGRRQGPLRDLVAIRVFDDHDGRQLTLDNIERTDGQGSSGRELAAAPLPTRPEGRFR